MFKSGSKTTLQWAVVGSEAGYVQLYYSIDGSKQFSLISDSEPVKGSYEWTIPIIPAKKVSGVIRVVAFNKTNKMLGNGYSGTFTIVSQ